MGLTDELAEAREWVATQLNYSAVPKEGGGAPLMSVFETTIRHLGGLLGIYTLTEDPLYLDKAVELADLLAPSFVIGDVPRSYFRQGAGGFEFVAQAASLADLGSKQLEFGYLTALTGNATYAKLANRFYEDLRELRMAHPEEDYTQVPGLFPVQWSGTEKGKPVEQLVTVGGRADSFYEYLLKVYLLNGERAEEEWLWHMFTDAVRGMRDRLILKDPSGATYITSYDLAAHSGCSHMMDHLSCFVGGMFALGAATESGLGDVLAVGKELTETCYGMYEGTATGLGAEIVLFTPAKGDRRGGGGRSTVDAVYNLRPETLESIYYMWLATKDPKYREMAWEIFVAIEEHCKGATGYSALYDVDATAGAQTKRRNHMNRMESFFLAETVKYLYLIFADPARNPVPLDRYVLNTEAHPFKKAPKQSKHFARLSRFLGSAASFWPSGCTVVFWTCSAALSTVGVAAVRARDPMLMILALSLMAALAALSFFTAQLRLKGQTRAQFCRVVLFGMILLMSALAAACWRGRRPRRAGWH